MPGNYYLQFQEPYIDTATTRYVNGAYWGGEYGTVISKDYGAQASMRIERDEAGKISPQLYFTYIKRKFGILERMKLDRRIKLIEAAFDEAVESGQNMLAEKILTDLSREIRESIIAAKGISEYIEREDLFRYKHKIKSGHISDTLLKDYTCVIPKEISDKIKKLKGAFDDFVIWHYYEEELEEKRAGKQKMSEGEKGKMRDPIVFGIIKETDRLYFIADWEDDYCDLTFDEIVDVIGSHRIGKKVEVGKVENK